MKILFIASANSIHSYKWIKYFADKGYNIVWASLTPYTQEKIDNIEFYELKGSFLSKFLELKKIIKKTKPDILHSHYAGFNGLIGALTNFQPFIITAWGSDILLAGKAFFKSPFIRYVLKKADLITCDAEHLKEAMIKLNTDIKKIKIIYFGIDTKRFKIKEKDKDLEKELGIKDSPVIISLRSLEKIYDVITLINAIPIVLKEFKDVKFLIAGKGEEEENIKERAKELKIVHSVRFLGFVQNNKLPNYLNTSDLYVSTSLSDGGIAASTAEAMASGLSVVITDNSDNGKWVKDNEGGYLIEEKNPEILANKIIDLLKDKEKREIFGKVNRKVIEEKNDYYKEMGKMEKIYLELKNK